MNPEGFLHVTLNTMHARITRPDEIASEVLAVLVPWARSPIAWRIPPTPEYRVVPEVLTPTSARWIVAGPAGELIALALSTEDGAARRPTPARPRFLSGDR